VNSKVKGKRKEGGRENKKIKGKNVKRRWDGLGMERIELWKKKETSR
jgi:hypothetical protein